MCKVTSKLFLTVISILFWLIAIALVVIGAWIFGTYHHYDELTKGTHILVPASIMITVGVFVFVLGCIGCVGAFKEQKCLLGVFFTVLLIILVGIVATSVLAYVFRHQVGSTLETNMMNGIKYYNESTYKHEMDYIQENLKCCGVNNKTDWEEYSPFFNKSEPYPYPESCCENNNCTSYNGTKVTNVYELGCYDKVRSNFVDHLAIIAGVTAAFAVLQLLGMISACFLFCRRTDDVPYIGLSEPNCMRV